RPRSSARRSGSAGLFLFEGAARDLKAGRPTGGFAYRRTALTARTKPNGRLGGSIAALSRRELTVGAPAGNVYLSVFTGESVPSPRHFLQCFLVFSRHLRDQFSAL